MKVKYWIIYFLFCFSLSLHAGSTYCFRVYLTDKGNSGYTTERPEEYLARPAIDRRVRSGIGITENDLPISSAYIDSLKEIGLSPVTQSKWLSTVVVSTKDSLLIEQVNNLSIVDSVKWVWKGIQRITDTPVPDTTRLYTSDPSLNNRYGYAENQIKMLKGDWLHEAGYTGKNISVAVIDAGFSNAGRIDVFGSLNLAGTYNVVQPGESVFTGDDHGTKVLSCMAANIPGIFVGTAPDADYWLIRSEDSNSEFPIEEDYWAAAVEFADSVGVNMITTSLGYFHFDEDELNYDQTQLDGKTAFISRAAEAAASKGLLIFCSAGNEGNNEWGKITFPSDASGILTVGSVTSKGEKSLFSSTGFTADYRVKPDVVALGSSCTVIDQAGAIRYANGTSFSTPVVAGLGACLLQAFPELTNKQVLEIMRTVSSYADRPDAEIGYGLPDMKKAYELGMKLTSGK